MTYNVFRGTLYRTLSLFLDAFKFNYDFVILK